MEDYPYRCQKMLMMWEENLRDAHLDLKGPDDIVDMEKQLLLKEKEIKSIKST